MPLYFRLIKKSPTFIKLSLTPWFRIIIGGMLFLFLFGMRTAGVSLSGLGILPWAFLIICVLSLLYQEEWFFNLASGKAVYRFGLIVFALKKEYSIDNINGFMLEAFTRGAQKEPPEGKKRFFQKQYFRLYFETANGEKKDLEIQGAGQKNRLEEKGKVLASFCSKPFTCL